MNTKIVITLIAFFCFIGNTKSATQNDSTKIYFDNALQEVKEMLEGSRPLDFQRAVFVTENAYHENNYSYKSFERAIKNHIYYINQLIRANNKSDSIDFNVKVNKNGRFNIDEIRYTPEQKKELYNNVVANWSIFTYLTDTTAFGSVVHYPYQYNAKDPFGMNNWANSQVINLLASNNSIGNCFALTALYKIFANQFNSDAVICTAPQHIYIQHKDHKGDWYNVELATAGHPADGSIQTLTYTTNKALMNDIALRTLNEKQSVALCLVNLAKSYEHKYHNKTDDFLLQCAELILKHDPKNLNALLLKQQVLDAKVVEYSRANNIDNIENLKKDKNINSQLQQLENHLAYLSELGYIQMPVDMQEVVLNGFKGENAAQFIKKDKNPSPFTTIDVPEEDNQYLDLSSGIFQEVFEPKEIETYGHFTFNTKNNELIKIDTQMVNNQIIDPVAFAYDLGARMYDARLGRMISIDKKTKLLPSFSPYMFVNNDPIRFVDPDGNFLIDVHKRIARNAFAISKLGVEVSDKILAFRKAIAGDINNDYSGSVVAPDVRTLPWYVGGGGQESDDALHFDNMNYTGIIKNYNAINSKLSSIVTSYKSGDLTAEQLGDQVGEYYHAVQDLYSHSNYIELYASIYGETEFKDIPTIDEAMSNNKYSAFAKLLKSDLKTGTYPGEGEGSHHDMNHDLGFGSKYTYVPEVKGKKVTWSSKAAETVATKATKQINDKIESDID